MSERVVREAAYLLESALNTMNVLSTGKTVTGMSPRQYIERAKFLLETDVQEVPDDQGG